MRIPRLFHPGLIEKDNALLLNKPATRHLLKALRAKLGSKVILFNGQGGEFKAEVTQIDRQQVWLTPQAYISTDAESPLKTHLVQVISRGEKMDLTIQKAVELGVTEITPLFSERCGVKLSAERLENKHQHWQNIIISACEQSGRNRLAKLNPAISLENFAQLKQDNALKLLLAPGSNESLSQIQPCPTAICLLVGPEGGLSDTEIGHLKKHHYQTLCLGPRILRTETAALVTLSILQHRWGDL